MSWNGILDTGKSNGGCNFHKRNTPGILYNYDISALASLDDNSNDSFRCQRIWTGNDTRHDWILCHLYKYIEKAVLNYCKDEDHNKSPLEYKLVSQQPEADKQTHTRMTYV